MTLLDPTSSRFAQVEARLVTIERDLAKIIERLAAIPTVWQLVFMIAPLYVVLILGFAGLILAMLNTRGGGG